MLSDLEEDALQDLEVRLYSQIYHASSEDPPLIPESTTDNVIDKITPMSKRYYSDITRTPQFGNIKKDNSLTFQNRKSTNSPSYIQNVININPVIHVSQTHSQPFHSNSQSMSENNLGCTIFSTQKQVFTAHTSVENVLKQCEKEGIQTSSSNLKLTKKQKRQMKFQAWKEKKKERNRLKKLEKEKNLSDKVDESETSQNITNQQKASTVTTPNKNLDISLDMTYHLDHLDRHKLLTSTPRNNKKKPEKKLKKSPLKKNVTNLNKIDEIVLSDTEAINSPQEVCVISSDDDSENLNDSEIFLNDTVKLDSKHVSTTQTRATDNEDDVIYIEPAPPEIISLVEDGENENTTNVSQDSELNNTTLKHNQKKGDGNKQKKTTNSSDLTKAGSTPNNSKNTKNNIQVSKNNSDNCKNKLSENDETVEHNDNVSQNITKNIKKNTKDSTENSNNNKLPTNNENVQSNVNESISKQNEYQSSPRKHKTTLNYANEEVINSKPIANEDITVENSSSNTLTTSGGNVKTKKKSLAKKKRQALAVRETSSTPDSTASNDFLDNSVMLQQNKFNFSLHGSDFGTFLKPKTTVDAYESESSCSTSDLGTPMKHSVFNEIEFESPNKQIFDENNMEVFSNFITPKRNNLGEESSLVKSAEESVNASKRLIARRQTHDSSDSSSESEYGESENNRRMKRLPSLSFIESLPETIIEKSGSVKRNRKRNRSKGNDEIDGLTKGDQVVVSKAKDVIGSKTKESGTSKAKESSTPKVKECSTSKAKESSTLKAKESCTPKAKVSSVSKIKDSSTSTIKDAQVSNTKVLSTPKAKSIGRLEEKNIQNSKEKCTEQTEGNDSNISNVKGIEEDTREGNDTVQKGNVQNLTKESTPMENSDDPNWENAKRRRLESPQSDIMNSTNDAKQECVKEKTAKKSNQKSIGNKNETASSVENEITEYSNKEKSFENKSLEGKQTKKRKSDSSFDGPNKKSKQNIVVSDDHKAGISEADKISSVSDKSNKSEGDNKVENIKSISVNKDHQQTDSLPSKEYSSVGNENNQSNYSQNDQCKANDNTKLTKENEIVSQEIKNTSEGIHLKDNQDISKNNQDTDTIKNLASKENLSVENKDASHEELGNISHQNLLNSPKGQSTSVDIGSKDNLDLQNQDADVCEGNQMDIVSEELENNSREITQKDQYKCDRNDTQQAVVEILSDDDEVEIVSSSKISLKRKKKSKSHNYFLGRSNLIVISGDEISDDSEIMNFSTEDLEIANCSFNSRENITVPLQASNVTRKNSLAEYWTDDMDKFYRSSWGLENYSVREEQQKMSDDPKMWKIIDRDRAYIAFNRPKGMKCHRCREYGHQAVRCPKQTSGPVCQLCGSRGHLDIRCPNKMCSNCGTPGMYATIYCSNCLRDRNKFCGMCNTKGHISERCSDIWRRYCYTTSEGPLTSFDKSIEKPIELRWCSGCAMQGHFEHDCNNYNRTHPRCNPKIISFRDVYRTTKKQSGLQLRAEDFSNISNFVSPSKSNSFQFGFSNNSNTLSITASKSGDQNSPNAIIIDQNTIANQVNISPEDRRELETNSSNLSNNYDPKSTAVSITSDRSVTSVTPTNIVVNISNNQSLTSETSTDEPVQKTSIEISNINTSNLSNLVASNSMETNTVINELNKINSSNFNTALSKQSGSGSISNVPINGPTSNEETSDVLGTSSNSVASKDSFKNTPAFLSFDKPLSSVIASTMSKNLGVPQFIPIEDSASIPAQKSTREDLRSLLTKRRQSLTGHPSPQPNEIYYYTDFETATFFAHSEPGKDYLSNIASDAEVFIEVFTNENDSNMNYIKLNGELERIKFAHEEIDNFVKYESTELMVPANSDKCVAFIEKCLKKIETNVYKPNQLLKNMWNLQDLIKKTSDYREIVNLRTALRPAYFHLNVCAIAQNGNSSESILRFKNWKGILKKSKPFVLDDSTKLSIQNTFNYLFFEKRSLDGYSIALKNVLEKEKEMIKLPVIKQQFSHFTKVRKSLTIPHKFLMAFPKLYKEVTVYDSKYAYNKFKELYKEFLVFVKSQKKK